MAKVGGDAWGIKITSTSATGSFNDISQYVEDFSGLNIEAVLSESHTFGDAWKEQLYTGFRQVGDITLKGKYDDAAATGPNALLGMANLGGERVVKLNFGTTNAYAKFDVMVKAYDVSPSRGAFTMFTSVLAPTGAVTTVTT